jgi:hypothetical protein
MLLPFSNTVEFAVKPVPYSATVAAVFVSPEFGEIDVSVGGGGFAIETVSTFDKAGVEVVLLTLTVAVPADASRLAGTWIVIDSCAQGTVPYSTPALLETGVPFHNTLDVRINSPEFGSVLISAKRLEP